MIPSKKLPSFLFQKDESICLVLPPNVHRQLALPTSSSTATILYASSQNLQKLFWSIP